MTNATLTGKPDAGNAHVRFDEREVASEKPRRGSLLYNKTTGALMVGLLVAGNAYCATPDYSDYVRLQTTGAFFTNALSSAEGWTPAPVPYKEELWAESNYVVASSSSLGLKALDTSGDQSFAGKQLVLDGNKVTLSVNNKTDRGKDVHFNDLILRRGEINNESASYSTSISGKITIDTKDYYAVSGATVNLSQGTATGGGSETDNPMSIRADLIAEEGNKLTLSCEKGWEKGEGGAKSRWYSRTRTYRFQGDCSQFFATVGPAKWRSIVVLGCSDFGGNVTLENLGRLSVWDSADGPANVALHGSVMMSDGWVQVPAGKSLSIGTLSSAYAPASTYVSNTGTNAYDGKAHTPEDPYVVKHTVPYSNGGLLYVNTLTVDANATLTLGDATLDGTLLDLGLGSRIDVTQSLEVRAPALLRLPLTGFVEMPVVTLPVSKGELRVSDFEIAVDRRALQYRLRVETSDGLQTLYAENIAPGTYDWTTGYVVLTNAEGNNATDAQSWTTGGWWSDGTPPHGTTNYYTAKTIRFRSSEFQGRSLSLNGGTHRIDTFGGIESQPSTVDDLRVLANGATFSSSSNGGLRRFIIDRLTVLTDPGKTFYLWASKKEVAGLPHFLMDVNFYGDADSTILAGADTDTAVNAYRATYTFRGNMSNYHGLCRLSRNATAVLGDTGLPGTIRMEEAEDLLTTAASDGAAVPVGKLVTQVSTTVDVAATNTLAVGALDVTGTLTKSGAGVLAVGGEPTVGTGAQLLVADGGLKPLSATAVAGLPVRFADGTKIVLDWEPEDADVAAKGLDLSQSTLTVDGSLSVAFDFKGAKPSKQTYERALFTVDDDDVSKVAGVTVRVKGFKAELAPVSAGGKTTYRATFTPSGLVLLFR